MQHFKVYFVLSSSFNVYFYVCNEFICTFLHIEYKYKLK